MNRVLVVDDHPENTYLLRALLSGHGFEVEEAVHGADALAKARREPPDIIVADLLMPVLDGYTLLRHWRADEQLRHIPFIVYTATYTEPRDERLALALGADAFLIKPTEPDVLLSEINRVLAKGVQARTPGNSASTEEAVLLKEYNEILIRKLEQKVMELEHANRDLKDEIGQRERASLALKSSEERYRNLFESIVDPLFVYDTQTLRYLMVNSAAIEKYGYSREEFLAMTVMDIRPPQDVPKLKELLARSQGAPEHRGIWRHRKKNGEIIDVQISTLPLPFEGQIAGLIEARDITEQRRAEADAARMGRLLRGVVEGTSDAVFVKDVNGTYLLCNEAVGRFLGKPISEIVGKKDSDLFGAADARLIAENDRLTMESNRAVTTEEILMTGNVERVFNVMKAPYRDENGEVVGVIGVSRDITRSKQLEEQLRQAQKMEAIGRLAGGVAHDFNNLLTIISSCSELLIEHPDAGTQVRELAQTIAGAGERASALTKQLLGFSRQSMLQPEVLDLNQVVMQTEKLLSRAMGEHIELITRLSPDIEHVRVDPTQLDQILINLAVNARDAMPKGGTLTIETKSTVFSDDYEVAHLDAKAGRYVMLAITDSGTGMTPEVKARVFEPFFTTKPKGQGTGLGMAMVLGIVQQSGGWIHVYSEPGIGTSIKIYLPAVNAAVTPRRAAAPQRTYGGSETVLLVEDDEGVREVAMASLQLHGYRVICASDGAEAIAMANQKGKIDLLLTDVVMPRMSGSELARDLRAQLPELKVLFMSGYTEDSVVRQGLLEASVAFIQKPYTPVSLARKVREVLDQPVQQGSEKPQASVAN